ncbi:MAG: hypothetical protein K2H16_07010, partial [Prevotella sp.]|nr:hypothetical protein [Prevotella sp.]
MNLHKASIFPTERGETPRLCRSFSLPMYGEKESKDYNRKGYIALTDKYSAYYMGGVKRLCRKLKDAVGIVFPYRRQVSEDDIQDIIAEVSSFFSLPRPRTSSRENVLAEMTLGKDNSSCELSYNISRLRSSGLYSRETLTLCFVHELAHQALRRHRFMLFSCERWMHELAADIAVGLYAAIHRLPTGEYKRAVAERSLSATHPDGSLRRAAVDYGREARPRRDMDGKALAKTVTDIMPSFVYTHHDTLERGWHSLM